MLQLSLPAGRWLGVHVRVHISLLLLLALASGYSAVATGSPMRGLALWLTLCAAVLVREVARAVTAAGYGMPLRGLVLLPVGGVMALGQRQGQDNPPLSRTRVLAYVGSAANGAVALVLLGFAYGVDPHVALVDQPWIAIEHILRSAVWLQLLVGIVNLIPSTTLPTRRLLRSKAPSATPPAGAGSPLRPNLNLGLGTAFALALMLSGVLFGLLWPVMLGATVLLTSYLTRAVGVGSADTMSLTVRDVMLTDFKPLNASITLRDALRQTTQTVGELFPVLRGERLVGWTSRTALAARLRAEGDGFLQAAMSRSLQAVSPGETIGEALRRATALGASEFIPVVEDGAMVGILTPVSLERAVGQLRLTHAPVERDAR